MKQWALKQLNEMSMLQQDWDSYDANPISPVAIATASKLLQEAEERFGDIAYQQLLEVVPRPDGGVGVTWKQWPLEIDVHTDHQGNLGYLYIVFHQNATEDYEEASNVSLDTVLALIAKVINRTNCCWQGG